MCTYVMYDLNRGKTICQSCMHKNKTNVSGIFPKLVQSQKHVCWNMEYLKTCYLSLAKRSPSKHKLGISIKGQDR